MITKTSIEKLLGLPEILELTGVCEGSIMRARHRGKFPQPDVKIGRRVLWKPATIHKWMDAGTKKK